MLSKHVQKDEDEQLVNLLVEKPTLFSMQDLIDVRNTYLQRMKIQTDLETK